MAKLSGWAISSLDAAVRQFRKDVTDRAQHIAEQRGARSASPDDIEEAVKGIRHETSSGTDSGGAKPTSGNVHDL
jgi:histone H3/H4